MAQEAVYEPISVGRHIDPNQVQQQRLEDVEDVFFVDKDGRGNLRNELKIALELERDQWLEQNRESFLDQFASDPLFQVEQEFPLEVILTSFSRNQIVFQIAFSMGYSRWHHYLILLRDYILQRNATTDKIFRIRQLEEVYAYQYQGVQYVMPFEEVIKNLGSGFLEKIHQPLHYRTLYYPEYNLEVVLQDEQVKYLNPVKPAWAHEFSREETGDPEEYPEFNYGNLHIVWEDPDGWIAYDNLGKRLFRIFPYDNGPDYPTEGLIRIIQDQKIGFANLEGAIVIPPAFDCAKTFKDGYALICEESTMEPDGEYHTWIEAKWGVIDTTGKVIIAPVDLGLFTFDILDLQLALLAEFDGKIMVQTRWEDLQQLHLFVTGDGAGLFVDLLLKDSGKQLLTYLYLPWQDLTFRQMPEADAPIPREKLVTVTHKTIAYLVDMTPSMTEEEMDLINDLANLMHRLLNVETNQQKLEEIDAFSSETGLRFIAVNTYPWYIEASIAIPGSASFSPDAVSPLFPRKMVLLHQVPDQGPVCSQWIKPGPPEDSRYNSHEFRQSPIAVPSIPDTPPTPYSDTSIPQCTDTLLDYMPGIMDELNMLPDFSPLNHLSQKTQDPPASPLNPEAISLIDTLFQLYAQVKKDAKRNPGKWVQGNPLLGAKEQEYEPSKEELMLMVFGNRIEAFYHAVSPGIWSEIKKKVKGIPDEIQFTRFLFIHFDVMGSGRFFYVEEMEDIQFSLN